MSQLTAKQQPFMRIGKQFFSLQEVAISNDDPSGWAGYTSFTTLVEKAKTLKLDTTESLILKFATCTSFNRSSARNKTYGVYYARLPCHSTFSQAWQDAGRSWPPPELASLVQARCY